MYFGSDGIVSYRLLPALSRGLKQFFREHLPKVEMEAEKLERFKRTVLTDKELYVAFSDVQMRYKSVLSNRFSNPLFAL